MFYTKFHQQRIINEDFEKKIEGRGAQNPHFFRKMRLILIGSLWIEMWRWIV